mmetsp:Transcript_61143/g.117866  ORF Transcript_61143/g.117866 Transcript_61143/m.117866 type:complete len:204 (-) Transcript_61143:8-619(-)
MTATLDELKQALVETLEHRGVLGQVKAKVRAEIFAALDDEHAPRPEMPRENVVINELIREYLEYNGYHHALSVLLPESGHPEERQFDRAFLASELQLQEDDRSRSLPLLYAFVRGLRPKQEAVAEAQGIGPLVGSSCGPHASAMQADALPPPLPPPASVRSSFPRDVGGTLAGEGGGCGSLRDSEDFFGSEQQLAPLIIRGAS